MCVEMNLKIIEKYDEFYKTALLDSELRYLVASTPIIDLEVKLSDWQKKQQPSVMSTASMFNPPK
jgi:hypothetical protein